MVTTGPAPRLVIPPTRTKAGRTREIPLIPEAAAILDRRRETTGGSGFVFPSSGKSGHLMRIHVAWHSALKRAEIEPAVPHDLRHTIAQAMHDSGVDYAVVSTVLGHATSALGVTATYAVPSLDRQRAGLERGVGHLTGGSTDGAVVPFEAAR